MERPNGTFPPCHYGPKECPKGSPEAGKALSELNQWAYAHYLECRAIGSFPDDGIVRENAAIIRGVEDAVAKIEQKKNLVDLFQMTRGI